MDRGIKSIQIVRAGDENVLYTSVFQSVEYTRSELGAFVLADPHPQNILPAV